MGLTLVLGNKNYSSWSLRPWIAMKMAGIPFEEVVIPLYEPGSAEKVKSYNPAGMVPVLMDDGVAVWETIAIIEYLADKFPDKGLWPKDRVARSHARVVSAEMHAGFAPLRKNCPMNIWLPPKKRDKPPEVLASAARIEAIWRDCRARFGEKGGGPFLFGAFCAADAMYAPVVTRFYNYAFDVASDTRAYMDAMRALPAFREWRSAALKEPWVMSHNEPDWPTVNKEAE
ncbi:MAG: glutathione S-transferase family protein [Pseudolabrys sp.]